MNPKIKETHNYQLIRVTPIRSFKLIRFPNNHKSSNKMSKSKQISPDRVSQTTINKNQLKQALDREPQITKSLRLPPRSKTKPHEHQSITDSKLQSNKARRSNKNLSKKHDSSTNLKLKNSRVFVP